MLTIVAYVVLGLFTLNILKLTTMFIMMKFELFGWVKVSPAGYAAVYAYKPNK